MSNDKVKTLIEELSGDLREPGPMPHPFIRTLPLIAVSILYVSAVVYMLGMRGDFMLKVFEDMVFVFELSLALSLSVAAGLCVGWLAVPDMRGQGWLKAVPVTLGGVFLFWAALRLSFEPGVFHALKLNHCTLDGFFMLLAPTALLTFVSRMGATTQPVWSAVMTVLSFSGLGWVGLRLTCGLDSFSHAFLQHFIPFMLAGVVIGLFARRIFRW